MAGRQDRLAPRVSLGRSTTSVGCARLIGMTVLDRLRRMTRDEVSWRARAAARVAADRVAVHIRPPGWRRGDIRTVLAPAALDAPLEAAIAEERWDDVHRGLAGRIRARGRRFVLDPSSAPSVADAVLQQDPAAAAKAARRADAILAGRYDLLGYRGLNVHGADGRIDWHLDPVHQARAPLRFWADVPYLDPAIGDHKIIWELNRHQHWLALGRALWLTRDERYRRRIIDDLYGWLAANPPLMGVNWASMLELGFRSMSWIWGLQFLLGIGDQGSGIGAPSPIPDPRSPWLIDLLVALDRQLTHIEQNLSIYFSPNTHLTGEALALYVAGVALPELAASRRHRDTGRRILLEEIDRQVLRDGGHAERSTHYHRYTLDFYLMALLTARLDGDADASHRFSAASIRLAGFARAMTDDTGRFPLIGDDDGGMLWPFTGRDCADIRDSLAVAAAVLERPELAPWGPQEEAFWVAGPPKLHAKAEGGHDVPPGGVSGFSRTASAATSRLFPDTGYAVFRDGRGGHAVFDVGPHGYMNGGHAHADALSITLTLDGRPVLVDPGTATYTMQPHIRDRFRGSASHNTLTIDGHSQSRPRGPFHWHTRANATLHGWRHTASLDWAEGSHDGYGSLTHRRNVVRSSSSGWLLVDEVLGAGRHSAAAHWHLDPLWTLSVDAPGRLLATHSGGGEAWILWDGDDVSLAYGDESSGLGWHAPVYGVWVPAWAARVTRTADAPFSMLTWIGTRPDSNRPPSMERVSPVCEAGDVAVAVRIITGARAASFVVCPSSGPAHHGCACDIGDYQTDARVFHAVEENGAVKAFDLVDGTRVVARRAGFSVVSSATIPDLHVALVDGVLDMQASHPPMQLRIDSSQAHALTSIRLNHRERPLPLDHAGTLLVYAADWAAPVRDLLPSLA
jgi:hypothetical protein